MKNTIKSTFDEEALRHQREEADRRARIAQFNAIASGTLPALDEYVDLQDLLSSVKPAFPTEDSVRWFVRRHRDALAAAGAVIIITGRMRYHPARFKQAAVAIGQKAAA